jgi:putative flippase GtrA
MIIMGLFDYGITTGLMALDLSPFWAKSWAALTGFAGNFILRRWLVFREKR